MYARFKIVMLIQSKAFKMALNKFICCQALTGITNLVKFGLFCTLISELRIQGELQTLENFQVL